MTELVTKPILYQCPICDSGYATMEEAVACRDQPCDWSGWKAGDLCLIPGKRVYTEPEDPMWVAFTQPADLSSDSHFDHKPTWHLWWVITCLHLHDRETMSEFSDAIYMNCNASVVCSECGDVNDADGSLSRRPSTTWNTT